MHTSLSDQNYPSPHIYFSSFCKNKSLIAPLLICNLSTFPFDVVHRISNSFSPIFAFSFCTLPLLLYKPRKHYLQTLRLNPPPSTLLHSHSLLFVSIYFYSFIPQPMYPQIGALIPSLLFQFSCPDNKFFSPSPSFTNILSPSHTQ